MTPTKGKLYKIEYTNFVVEYGLCIQANCFSNPQLFLVKSKFLIGKQIKYIENILVVEEIV